MQWPSVDYTGLDLLPAMALQNQELVNSTIGRFGLRSARFAVHDMLQKALPPATLLLTKDTLIHFRNDDIQRFLKLSVLACPPRFRYVMFVHDMERRPGRRANNWDIEERANAYHYLNLSAPPFSVPGLVEVFHWHPSGRSSGDLGPLPHKTIQILRASDVGCMQTTKER